MKLRGIQPRDITGAAARAAERAYATRFRDYRPWKEETDPDDAANAYRFYRFVTRRVKLFDEREFGGAVLVTASVRADRA